jgi:lipopolysaccharide assembly outer membrane protein LptD (OstA)
MIWVIMLIVFFSCNSRDIQQTDIQGVEDFNNNEIENPYIVITRENVPLVKASSRFLVKDENADAVLKGLVKADFFDDNGIQISQLTSDSAHIDQRTNNLYAYGNVKVVSDDSVKLFSKSILWDNHYKLITSNDSVMFTSADNDTMYGVGFESDMDLTKWKIKKPRGVSGKTKF